MVKGRQLTKNSGLLRMSSRVQGSTGIIIVILVEVE